MAKKLILDENFKIYFKTRRRNKEMTIPLSREIAKLHLRVAELMLKVANLEKKIKVK